MDLDLDQARRQAKEPLRAARSGDAQARARLRSDRTPRLADAQAAVARELGYSSGPALVAGVPNAPAGRAVASLDWNVRRSGVVFMQAPRGCALEWVISRTAQASVAVCDAILQLADEPPRSR
ncbi:MAG: hypothetical protein ACHQCG_02935 [Solirubrobacterales bacterium]